MKKFVLGNINESDILCGRNMVSKEGEVIRALLGDCTSNHNAFIIKHHKYGLGVGDVHPPIASFVPFSTYEDMINAETYEVRILRIKGITEIQKLDISRHWEDMIEGKPYSSVAVRRLFWLRLFNYLPYRIDGMWCTRAMGDICKEVFRDDQNIFRKIYHEGMPLEKNENPRTIEHRLSQGMLRDVTDLVIQEV